MAKATADAGRAPRSHPLPQLEADAMELEALATV